MLHGFLMDHTMFDKQKAAFGKTHRIIAIDSYGHGNSSPGTRAFTYWDTAQQIARLLGHLGISPATILGMSQGGFTALRLAITAPDLVSSLILVGSEAASMPEIVQHEMRDLFTSWDNVRTNPDVIAGLAGQIIGCKKFWGKWPWLWGEIPQNQLALAAKCLIERDDITHMLHQIQARKLVIVGENDGAVSPTVQRKLAQSLPDCSGVTVVPEAGHAANMTHPGPVNDSIHEFLIF
ncbi:alpha/beta hydrolase [Acaricomes phytoseiuli]|uniref:alpha/beta fold hydrolase n=1 Tax=Acaricomes phytoseiuli TaxID=291968 RepID=UPI002223D276|nr:alpha/beta hydrolase [Acaricomes phytoseiuli]MCW1250622.1 alpha/beta hydrolase [Acaricomes phytoseiuli]